MYNVNAQMVLVDNMEAEQLKSYSQTRLPISFYQER